jgi:hypothetical protein
VTEPSIPEQGRPDPTVLTTEAQVRGLAAERDYVDGQIAVLKERLGAVDKATSLLSEHVNRTPTDVTKEVAHLRELVEEKVATVIALMEERFVSVQTQFAERDERAAREARDNTIKVDAAFAAQKEAAQKAEDAAQKAIDKSDTATADRIEKLSQLVDAKFASSDDKVETMTRRMDKLV